jgi:YD repeat-containing protein
MDSSMQLRGLMDKKSVFSLLLIITLKLSATVAPACGLDWNLPSNYFDGVNEQGYVSYWTQLGVVDLADGLKLPLNVNFSSKRDESRPSPYLGQGWMIPLLESSIVQTGEDSFVMTQPDGWTDLFGRDHAGSNILNGPSSWKAEIKGDTVTAWAPCGWRLEFYKGHITSITTPMNRRLEIAYSGDLAVGLRENGVTKLSVERDGLTGKVDALDFNGQSIGISTGEKPRIQTIGGQSLLGGMDSSLKSLSFADKTSEIFEYATNDKMLPTLKITKTGDPDRLFTWDPSTKYIVNDNDWNYKISPGRNAYSNAAIGRTNAIKQSEFWFNDPQNGREITQGVNGVKKIEEWFVGGALNDDTRRVREILPDGHVEERRYSYDESGNLLRVFDTGAPELVQITEALNHLNGSTLGKLPISLNFEPVAKDSRLVCTSRAGGVYEISEFLHDGTVVKHFVDSVAQVGTLYLKDGDVVNEWFKPRTWWKPNPLNITTKKS